MAFCEALLVVLHEAMFKAEVMKLIKEGEQSHTVSIHNDFLFDTQKALQVEKHASSVHKVYLSQMCCSSVTTVALMSLFEKHNGRQ